MYENWLLSEQLSNDPYRLLVSLDVNDKPYFRAAIPCRRESVGRRSSGLSTKHERAAPALLESPQDPKIGASPGETARLEMKSGTLQDTTTTNSQPRPWLTSAWKPSPTQALSHSSLSWPSPHNGYLCTSNPVHCEKEKPISSTYWWQRSSFATPGLVTRTPAGFLTTGTRTSRPKMVVRAWRQRRPQGSGIVGSVKCPNRHVLITARPANGRCRTCQRFFSRSISDKTSDVS